MSEMTKKGKIRVILKSSGILGWAFGLISLVFGMTSASGANSFGQLTYTNFIGLLMVTFFISGTIVYMKSIDYE